jgi:hypothetical protein
VDRPNPLEGAQEIQHMLVAYAKQETVEPLKQLGRYLGLGLAGAVLIFAGAFFVGLGTLRLLQTISTFEGSGWFSTVPYLAAIAVLALLVAVMSLALRRAKKKVR